MLRIFILNMSLRFHVSDHMPYVFSLVCIMWESRALSIDPRIHQQFQCNDYLSSVACELRRYLSSTKLDQLSKNITVGIIKR